jgi:phage terminase small subunit
MEIPNVAPLPNIRQERFVQGLFEGKSATQAYADAGYRPHQGNSSRLRWFEMVQQRLAELQAEAIKDSTVTFQSLMNELEDLRVKAVSRDQYAAGVRAVAEKIKLSGLATTKIEIKQDDLTDDMDEREILAVVAKEKGPQAAWHLAMAFGLSPSQYGIMLEGEVIAGQDEVIGGKDPEMRDAGLTPKTFRPAVKSLPPVSQYELEATKPRRR